LFFDTLLIPKLGLSNFSLPVRPSSIEKYPPSNTFAFTNKAMATILIQFGYLSSNISPQKEGKESLEEILTQKDQELINRCLEGKLSATDLSLVEYQSSQIMNVKLQKLSLEQWSGSWSTAAAFFNSKPQDDSSSKGKSGQESPLHQSRKLDDESSEESQENKYVQEYFDSDSDKDGDLTDKRPPKISPFKGVQKVSSPSILQQGESRMKTSGIHSSKTAKELAEKGQNSVALKSVDALNPESIAYLPNALEEKPQGSVNLEKPHEFHDSRMGQQGDSIDMSVKFANQDQESHDEGRSNHHNLRLRQNTRLGATTSGRSNEYMTAEHAVANFVAQRWNVSSHLKLQIREEGSAYTPDSRRSKSNSFSFHGSGEKPKSLPMISSSSSHGHSKDKPLNFPESKLSKFGQQDKETIPGHQPPEQKPTSLKQSSPNSTIN
jgi:hypothetical protein